MNHSIDADQARRATLGRESDFGLQIPEGIDETTFLLSEPAAEAAPISPVFSERSFNEGFAEDVGDFGGDAAPLEDITDFPPLQEPYLSSDDGVTHDVEMTEVTAPALERKRDPKPKRKTKRISKYGIEYPPLPPAFVKRVAQTSLQSSGLSNSKISADTLTALTQASEWFFEQLGDDLGAYANHAKRKTIEESDVVTLMRRYVLPSDIIYDL